MWYCPACKAHKEATKTLQLATAPEILMIQLKRFSMVGSKTIKLDMPVECPLRLGLECACRSEGKHCHMLCAAAC